MTSKPRRRAGTRLGRCAAVGAILFATALLGLPVTTDADGLRWSEPIRVSTSIAGQVDWFPRVAADDFGNVHVIWNSTAYDDNKGHNATDPEALGQLEYARWNGQSWTQQTDIGLIWYGYALRNALAVDPSGRLHLIYKGWGSLERPREGRAVQDLWYTSADGTQADAVYAWRTPKQISSGKPGYFSDVALDSRGVIHAIWTEGDASGVYALFYTHSSDGGATWSRPITLSGDEPTWWYRAHLKIDAHDRLHVVWEVTGDDSTSPATGIRFGVTRKAVYALSLDGGFTWVKHAFVEPLPAGSDAEATPGPQQPVVGIDRKGTILFIFRDPVSNRVLFRQSADGERWSAPEPIPGIVSGVARPYDVYDTATDSAGHVHLAAIGYTQGSTAMSVLHAEWDGRAWHRAEVVASGPPYPEYPRLAVGEGNRLHIVWFGGDVDSIERTPDGIWYATTTTSAPRTVGLSPALLPSPRVIGTPDASPTPAAVVTVPTIEPLPEAARASYGADREPQGLVAVGRSHVFPVLVALLPAALVIIALFAGAFGLPDRLAQRLKRE